MAGDWIKMRCNLWDDPRVSGLADSIRTHEATIIGGLYWLWATADQHTEDGYLIGMTLKSVDRKTGIKGFGAALTDIGWIEEDDKGVQIIRFEEHNGSSAKERAQTARRVANNRGKSNENVTPPPLQKQQEKDGICNGDGVSGALPREEKIRDKDVNPLSLRDVPPGDAKKKKSNAVPLGQWLQEVKAKGEKAVSDYPPLWEHCSKAGIPAEWIEIAWLKFRERYTTDEKAARKRYANWRLVFLRAVSENWLNLWYWSDKDKTFHLTTVGVTADMTTREAA